MKNKLHKYLLSLFVFSIIFTGCHNQDTKSAPTVQETAAGSIVSTHKGVEPTEVVVKEMATESKLDNLEITLPPDMALEGDTATSKSIMHDGQIVGGVILLDLSEDVLSDPYSDELIDYLKNDVMQNINDSDFDYIAESSLHAYVEVSFSNTEKEYIHYILLGNSASYDVWLDRSLVTADEELQIIQSVQSEDITSDLNTISVSETIAFETKEFQFDLPDEMERTNVTDSSCLITRDGETVGGYAVTDFRKGVLTDPASNEEEIISTLINSVNEQIDLSDFDAVVSQDFYVKVVFRNAEEEYEHYIIYCSEVDTYYDIWFDSNQVNSETIAQIVNTTSVVLQ